MRRQKVQQTGAMRQGDCFLQMVPMRPKAGKNLQERGRVILLHGEATGHCHEILTAAGAISADMPIAQFFEERDGNRFLFIDDAAPELDALRCRNTRTGDICYIPASADVTQYQNLVAEEPETVRGVILRHDEHLPFVILPGCHQVGGGTGTGRQREYSPEAIRNVAD